MNESRPRIGITAAPRPGLRSLAGLRHDIQTEPFKSLWESLLAEADGDAAAEPLEPGSRYPGRPELHARTANRDYTVVNRVSRRVQTAALAALVTGRETYRDSALRQMACLFDEAKWPEWRDKAHPYVAADLRTGALCSALALSYDWLAPMLDGGQRRWIVEGLDRQGFRPFFKAVAEKAFFIDSMNNWMTCVVGGMGIAGMALGEDYPRSRELIDLALPRMENYLRQYGAEGEFNESVGYSNATILAVEFYWAHRYWTGGGDNRLGRTPFPEFVRWLMAMTLPPGRLAVLGDGHVDAPPATVQVAAIAAAGRDPVLQGFRRTYPEPDGLRTDRVKALLWEDPSVPAESPDGRLPKGKVFREQGMVYSSRSDWHPRAAACVVYGKGGRGREMHGHHDAGQVCVDGHGERLITDPGNPSNYPADFFGANRWRYYNASVWGHNLLCFDAQDQRPGAEAKAEWVEAAFDERLGGGWVMDLTGNYAGVKRVRRTLLHALPAVVAVLDEAELEAPKAISLRWHTVDRSEPEASGRFKVERNGVRLAGLVTALDGAALTLRRGEHGYASPFDRGRLGELLDQRRESYVEAALKADRCRLLTLFAVFGPGEEAGEWAFENGRWTIRTAQGVVSVMETNGRLEAVSAAGSVASPG